MMRRIMMLLAVATLMVVIIVLDSGAALAQSTSARAPGVESFLGQSLAIAVARAALGGDISIEVINTPSGREAEIQHLPNVQIQCIRNAPVGAIAATNNTVSVTCVPAGV